MAYTKQDPTTGDPITQVLLRTMETQYDEVKTELETGAGGSDIQPDGSNLVAGSVSDTQLGNRTANPATGTAYALEGTATQHLSWLTKNIKALKGVAGNWWDAASATIEGIWAKFDATTGHAHGAAAGDGPNIPYANLSGTPNLPYATIKYDEVRYVVPGWWWEAIANTFALGDGTIAYVPIYVAETTTYTSIIIVVDSPAAASTVQLAIYEWDNGLPGALILDAGTVATTGSGLKSIVISQELTGGRFYFLAARASGGAPVLYAFSGAYSGPISGHLTTITTATTPIFRMGVTGTITDPATAPTATATNAPAIFLREN